MGQKYFPFFVDISGYQVLVVGAGTIALRRTSALLRFGSRVTVVAPRIREEFQDLQAEYGEAQLRLWQKCFASGMTEGFDLVLSATDSRKTDHSVWEACKKHGIWVNVASDQSLCDFRFPALIEKEEIVAGVTSNDNDHRSVRSISAKIRETLETENRNIDRAEKADYSRPECRESKTAAGQAGREGRNQ